MLRVLLNNFKLTSNFLERKTVRELVLFLCRNQVDKVEVGLIKSRISNSIQSINGTDNTFHKG
ncbi:hypothetical protein QE390_002412 [Siphonobacter sp. SORGH_AS 1065]|nr:hypothetical protein [Siphonobacter sp. SORGH_AS_1065]